MSPNQKQQISKTKLKLYLLNIVICKLFVICELLIVPLAPLWGILDVECCTLDVRC